jgi:hypothetical protein
LQHLYHQGVQIDWLELCSGKPGIVAKLVDQPLHRIDLVNNGLDRLREKRQFGSANLSASFISSRSADNCMGVKRVLDLVRQSRATSPQA